MCFRDWKRNILTIPNLLSLFRLGLIPVYTTLYLNAREAYQYFMAGSILAISCLTDALDGRIARRFNMVSTLGIILDPLADKITQLTLTVCLSIRYSALKPILILFMVKEIFQLVLGIVNLSQGKMLPGALISGKICTTVLFVSLITLVVFPNTDNGIVSCIAVLDGIFLVVAFISYITAYFGKSTKMQNLDLE